MGAAEEDWWGILGSSPSCHCSLEGYPSSVIPARISSPPGMPWEAEKSMMAMVGSSLSLRDCAVFTPHRSNWFDVELPTLSLSLHIGPSDRIHSQLPPPHFFEFLNKNVVFQTMCENHAITMFQSNAAYEPQCSPQMIKHTSVAAERLCCLHCRTCVHVFVLKLLKLLLV